MLFETREFNNLKKEILNKKNAAIIAHKGPDGDAIGSCLALYFFLKKLSINAHIIIPDAIPQFYNWIEDIDKILVYEKNIENAKNLLENTDLIFMLDFSELKRIDKLSALVENNKALKVVIDHHPNNEKIADYMFVDSSYSSAAELLYNFMKSFDIHNIDDKIAEYIFLGMVSDTGSFRFDSAGSDTFQAASEILKYNIDKAKIMDGLFNTYSYDRLKLLGYVLSNKTVFLKDKHVTYMSISLEDKKKFNYKKGDHEFFVNWGLSIAESNMSVLFLETKEKIRISLRSKGKKVNVRKIAKEYYSGGGHFNASGGDSFKSLEQTIKDFVDNIDEILKISLEK